MQWYSNIIFKTLLWAVLENHDHYIYSFPPPPILVLSYLIRSYPVLPFFSATYRFFSVILRFFLFSSIFLYFLNFSILPSSFFSPSPTNFQLISGARPATPFGGWGSPQPPYPKGPVVTPFLVPIPSYFSIFHYPIYILNLPYLFISLMFPYLWGHEEETNKHSSQLTSIFFLTFLFILYFHIDSSIAYILHPWLS